MRSLSCARVQLGGCCSPCDCRGIASSGGLTMGSMYASPDTCIITPMADTCRVGCGIQPAMKMHSSSASTTRNAEGMKSALS